MKELLEAWKKVDRDTVAVGLSLVPGLGHLYKHHYVAGFGILTLGNVLVLFIAALLSFATLGLSLLVVPALWAGCVACSAYMAGDAHGHHPWLHGWSHRLQVKPVRAGRG